MENFHAAAPRLYIEYEQAEENPRKIQYIYKCPIAILVIIQKIYFYVFGIILLYILHTGVITRHNNKTLFQCILFKNFQGLITGNYVYSIQIRTWTGTPEKKREN